MYKLYNTIISVYPKLSPYAKIFYSEWLLDPDSSHYNMVIDQVFYGELDISRLNNALYRYVNEHFVLNSHVEKIEDSQYWVPNQKIYELEYKEGEVLSSDCNDLLMYVSRGFDLHNGPLYRFKLIKLKAGVYRFILVFHHIAVDGESTDEGIFKNISDYYNESNYKSSYSIDEQIALLNDLTESLSTKLDLNEDQCRQFWQEKLSTIEEIDLKFLKSKLNEGKEIKTTTNIVEEIKFSFAEEELVNLNCLKRKYLITTYIFGQCVLAVLLNRYTGQESLAICYPVAIKEGINFIYGGQVNTNLIPYHFNPTVSLTELFTQAREFFKSLKQKDINYGYYPIEDIIQLSNKRLLNTWFIQANFKDETFKFNGINKVEVLDEFNIDAISPLFYTDWGSPLYFEQELRDNQLNYRIRYDRSIIDKSLLENFTNSYRTLFLEILTDLTAGSIKSIYEYSILNLKEYHKIIYEWNQTEKSVQENLLIHQLFEEQVTKTPYQVALIYENIKLTYLELDQITNQLAHYLKHNYQVKADDLVALYLERSQFILIAILSILKAGGAYVPLDPSHPNDRIIYILKDTKTRLLLLNEDSQFKLAQLLSDNDLNSVSLLAIDSVGLQLKLAVKPEKNFNSHNSSRSLAYVIYTSGTTGKPKGVMIEHRSVVNRIKWMNDTYPLSSKDKILQKTPYIFDVSVWELFWGICYGTSIVFAKPDGHKDGNYLINLINRENVSVIHFVPCMLSVFEDTLEAVKADLSSLRHVFCSGEALDIKQVKKFHELLPNVKIHNLYGPTEATVDVLYYDCSDKNIREVLIGRPIDNTKIYILDNNLNVLPTGAIGELYISGIGLARGYLNLPQLTKENFIPNPFCINDNQEDNSILYKTGDLARWLPDGNIEYIGRRDSQVKIRGYRIELGEIEVVLSQFPRVKQCVVLAKEFADINNKLTGNKYLVGYYTLNISDDVRNVNDFVSNWQDTYQQTYRCLNLKAYGNDFRGWNSSYTGLPIEEIEMQEWLNNAITKLKKVNPEYVLEIGSGSGLILFNAIKFCKYYYASDFSAQAVNYLQQGITDNDLKDKAIVFNCKADNIPFNQVTKPVDTVVINSVVQYFPNIDYLEQSIKSLILNLPNLSYIFLGDIRDYRLMDIFYYSLLIYKQGTTTQREIDFYKTRDKELLISPAYFINLARFCPVISHVEILAKECTFGNEMSKFRYDVLLHLKSHNDNLKIIQYNQFNLITALEDFIVNNSQSDCIFLKYPNKNIYIDYQSYKAFKNKEFIIDERSYLNIREIRQLALKQDFNGIFLIDIYDCAYLNIILYKCRLGTQKFKVDYNFNQNIELYNNPSQLFKMLHSQVSQEIKQYLSQKLPSYMMPDILINIDQFPVTVNGKLDREALPIPEFVSIENYVAPRNELETIICQDFAQILGLPEDQIGINHDFFKLGGNSVLAIKLVAKLQLDFKISVADLFKLKTPAQISQSVFAIKDNLFSKLEQVKLNCLKKSNIPLKDKIDMDKKYIEYMNKVHQFNFTPKLKNINNILLTGSTGYLGCNILYQLLLNSNYKIYLLIRAESDEEAYYRIKDRFYYYFDIDLEFYRERIVILAAYLEKKSLGLNIKKYYELTANINSIIHAAALVKHYGNYEDFYQANVQATVNLLDLARATCVKDFHYISTLGIFFDGYVPDREYYVFDENDNQQVLLGSNSVYLQTKHEGEMITINYRKYGVNTNIYRVGNLLIQSMNYRTQYNIEDNAFFIRCKAILNLGMMPNEISEVEISPVDYTALAITKIFDQVQLSNATYHIFNPNMWNLAKLLNTCKTIHIEETSIDKFIDRVCLELKLNNDNRQLELFMLNQLWLQDSNQRSTKIKIVQNMTNKILENLDFNWPSLAPKKLCNSILSSLRSD